MPLNKTEQPDIAWTRFVRLSHWLVALCVLVNFVNNTGFWHRTIGYVSIGLVLMRVLYGLCVSQQPSSRFYMPTLASIQLHLIELRTKQFTPHTGHNPLGQLAVYLMWLIMALLGLTGWLSRTDAYWGEDWPVNLHQYLSNILMGLVVLHLVAIYCVSRLSRRHLLKQMVDGRQHEL
jgi:cytochrome b